MSYIFLKEKLASSHQACPPFHFWLSARLCDPMKSLPDFLFITTHACARPTLWMWAWPLRNVLNIYHNSPVILLCPHIHPETELLPFTLTLLSEKSFLPMFSWFFDSSLNWLCPLTIAVTTGHCCLQHFISFGVITVETEKNKVIKGNDNLFFLTLSSLGSWLYLTIILSPATTSHWPLIYQVTLSWKVLLSFLFICRKT